jgi:hypothetical protein
VGTTDLVPEVDEEVRDVFDDEDDEAEAMKDERIDADLLQGLCRSQPEI